MNITCEPVQAVIDLISENVKNGMVVCEVGCFGGETSIGYLPLIKTCGGKAYLIDWFYGSINAGSGPHGYNPDQHDELYNKLVNNLKEIDCLNEVQILDGISYEMIKRIPDKSLDIGFLDASHKYNDVYQDIMAILPKMKDQSILCGHDFEGFEHIGASEEQLQQECVGQIHYGVIQAVYDIFGKDIEIRKSTIGQSAHIPIWVKCINESY